MTWTIHVLLTERPADLTDLWEQGLAPDPTDPARADLTTSDGAVVQVELTASVIDPELTRGAALSLLHEKVDPVVAGHVAVLTLTSTTEAPVSTQIRSLCEAVVTLAPQPDAVVWFPHRRQVTTQVMFVGELLETAARAFFWVHATWIDADHTTSLATARGLSSIGLRDLQVTGTDLSPARLYAELTDFVAEALASNDFPGEGQRVRIGGVEFVGVPDTDVFTEEPLLGLVPTGATNEARAGDDPSVSAELPAYDPEQSGEAFYLLLDRVPASLGDVMVDYMPRYSAVLQAEGALTAEIPYERERARTDLALVGRIDDPALGDHATRADRTRSDANQANNLSASQRVDQHVAAVRIGAVGECSIYDLVMYQVAWAQGLSERPEVLGVWIPWQELFEIDGATLAEGGARLAHIEVHPGTSEGMDVLYTRGLRRFGGKELIVHDPKGGTAMRELLLMLADDQVQAGRFPRSGDTARTSVRTLKAVFHDADDVVTGEPALNVELQKRKFLGLF